MSMSAPDMRPFPMMAGPPIPWFMAQAIHEHLYHNSQALEQIAERGGFGWDEVAYMWSPKHRTTPKQRAECSRAIHDALQSA